MKPARRTSLLLGALGVLVAGAACGPTLRIEPAVGDEPAAVQRIQKEWEERGPAQDCQRLLESFAGHWKAGRSQEAWELLSPAFRARWNERSKALGLDGEKLFAQGLLPRQDMPSWDPVATFSGPAPWFVTGPAPELEIPDRPERRSFWVVQADGGQVPMVVVRQGERSFLEPPLGL